MSENIKDMKKDSKELFWILESKNIFRPLYLVRDSFIIF